MLWSLSIEEVFYLGFPLLCLLLRKDWILAPVLFLFALSLPISRAAVVGNEIWLEKAYLPGMAAIASGALGALVAARFCPKPTVTLSLCAFGASGIIAVLCWEDKIWRVIGNGTMLLLTFSTVCLLLAFHWRSSNGGAWSIPGTGWLRSFGRLSYEIYLTQMFVIVYGVSLFEKSGAGLWWGILLYVPALVFSWMLGWLVARYISTPASHFLQADS